MKPLGRAFEGVFRVAIQTVPEEEYDNRCPSKAPIPDKSVVDVVAEKIHGLTLQFRTGKQAICTKDTGANSISQEGFRPCFACSVDAAVKSGFPPVLELIVRDAEN